MDPNSDRPQIDPVFPHYSQHTSYSGNISSNRILLGAVISLTVVIILVLILHIYARCALKNRPTTTLLHRSNATTVQHHFPVGHPEYHLRQLSPSTTTATRSGLDHAVIASLPAFTVKEYYTSYYSLHNAEEAVAAECAVCLSVLEEEEMARLLPNCNHVFHVDCVDLWLVSHTTCPLCRKEVAPASLTQMDNDHQQEQQQVVMVVVEQHDHDESSSGTTAAAAAAGRAQSVEAGVVEEDEEGSKIGSGSTSFRLSSFRRMLGRDSRSSRRSSVRSCGQEEDLGTS